MGVKRFPSWSHALPVGAGIFDLYDSQGDVTIDEATYIPTEIDGPMVVARYGALNVNALLTAQNRCRGLVILCDTLSVGAAGIISMSRRGAVGGQSWLVGGELTAANDITVPDRLDLTASTAQLRDILTYIRRKNLFVGDPVSWMRPPVGMGDCVGTITPGEQLISALGGGLGGSLLYSTSTNHSYGLNGQAGVKAPGGGGGGSLGGTSGQAITGRGQRGWPWGGGSAGGGASGYYVLARDADPWSGGGGAAAAASGYCVGGAAGNPGAAGAGIVSPGQDGTGGILIIICRGAVTVAGKIEANGAAGGNCTLGYVSVAGSASGGGAVVLISPDAWPQTGTVSAASGTPGVATGGTTGNLRGAFGGAGAVIEKTFAQMGWAA